MTEGPTLASLLLSTAAGLKESTRSISSLLNEPDSVDYLSSLLSLPLSTLTTLPTSLTSLNQSLDSDLSNLAFTKYNSILLSNSIASSISTSFDSLSTSLNHLLSSATDLESTASQFESRIHSVKQQRERMIKVRERMDQVEELLEAPAVVEACVRAGYWSEAIDVALRLSDLYGRLLLAHPTSSASAAHDEVRQDDEMVPGRGAIVLLRRVRKDVALALLSLRSRVLESLLQRGLKLPGAVRGISILRRVDEAGQDLEGEVMAVSTIASSRMKEEALRIVFLAARWKCLRSELDSIEGQMVASGIKLATSKSSRSVEEVIVSPEDNEERTRWIKRWIELWREIIGETIGMYAEVFLTNHQEEEEEDAIAALDSITLFLSTSIATLSTLLAHALPFITSVSSLSSILTQVIYCSHSFARYGLEFRESSQIEEIIERRVGKIIIIEWERAGRVWEAELRDGWEGRSSSINSRKGRKGKSTVAEWLVVPEGFNTVLATPSPLIIEPWSPSPPTALALLPPLAHLLNSHANAFNSLRLLPALSLYPALRGSHNKELDRAARVLEAFVDAWIAVSSHSASSSTSPNGVNPDEDLVAERRREAEIQLIVFTVQAFARWMIPWCESALRIGVYGGEMGDVESEALERSRLRIEAVATRVEEVFQRKDHVVSLEIE